MMQGSNGTSSNAPAPFLIKTYEMVDDPLTNPVVSWSHSGHSFVVWNPPEFARDLLPTYFKHNNFSSFIRQLNTYGFRKVDPDQWEFANEEFIRGQGHLLKNIYRRKPIHSHSGQGNAVPLIDSERAEFEKEIEKLKNDKVLLQSELEVHKQEKHRYEYELLSLGQRLQNVGQRHRQLMSALAQLLQKPGHISNPMEHLEPHNKKRRLLALNYLHDEVVGGETKIKADSSSISSPFLNMEVVEKMDASLTFWENFLHGTSHTPSEELHGFSAHPFPSPVIITEMSTSSDDSDFNVLSCSPKCPMSTSRDCYSSPEIAAPDHMDSPAISSICTDLDARQKQSGIDINMSPFKAQDSEISENLVQNGTTHSVSMGANDVFWQQFLTEAPSSSEAHEVQSERKYFEDTAPSKLADDQRPWWNVDKLAHHVGHHTQVERT